MARAGGGQGGARQHGDLRTAILSALGGEAKNGHQVMQAIAAASGGTWMPSAGQVYPMLQQLTDEGLLTARADGERTVYTLTEAGREAAAAAHEAASGAGREGRDSSGRAGWKRPDWDMSEFVDRMSGRWNDHRAEHTTAVPRAGAKLAQAAAQVASTGTKEQQQRAAALLDETRRKLYAILAEETVHTAPSEHVDHAEHAEHAAHTED
jgi:DNA-binding PadR family transcriptional regulator